MNEETQQEKEDQERRERGLKEVDEQRTYDMRMGYDAFRWRHFHSA